MRISSLLNLTPTNEEQSTLSHPSSLSLAGSASTCSVHVASVPPPPPPSPSSLLSEVEIKPGYAGQWVVMTEPTVKIRRGAAIFTDQLGMGTVKRIYGHHDGWYLLEFSQPARSWVLEAHHLWLDLGWAGADGLYQVKSISIFSSYLGNNLTLDRFQNLLAQHGSDEALAPSQEEDVAVKSAGHQAR